MSYRGEVKNGVVVLEPGAALQEGTQVDVEPVAPLIVATLAERLQAVVGRASGLPVDLAAQHDHYLHGQPKR